MATAGSGDVLSGILAATAAYILSPLESTALAAYINGAAGELAESKTNPISMTAGDTARAIPEIITEILK
jgi:NAD(P)H-hydrate epimerase